MMSRSFTLSSWSLDRWMRCIPRPSLISPKARMCARCSARTSSSRRSSYTSDTTMDTRNVPTMTMTTTVGMMLLPSKALTSSPASLPRLMRLTTMKDTGRDTVENSVRCSTAHTAYATPVVALTSKPMNTAPAADHCSVVVFQNVHWNVVTSTVAGTANDTSMGVVAAVTGTTAPVSGCTSSTDVTDDTSVSFAFAQLLGLRDHCVTNASATPASVRSLGRASGVNGDPVRTRATSGRLSSRDRRASTSDRPVVWRDTGRQASTRTTAAVS